MIKFHNNVCDASDLGVVIARLLPEQGAIEVQNDSAGKLHDWHHHHVDETLVILRGTVRFFWAGGERICKPGDAISLPARTRHGSEALDGGATYAIAFDRADIF